MDSKNYRIALENKVKSLEKENSRLLNILGAERVKLVDNLKEILENEFRHPYASEEDIAFFGRYSGKIVDIYEKDSYFYILEDDDYVLTEECFEEKSLG